MSVNVKFIYRNLVVQEISADIMVDMYVKLVIYNVFIKRRHTNILLIFIMSFNCPGTETV